MSVSDGGVKAVGADVDVGVVSWGRDVQPVALAGCELGALARGKGGACLFAVLEDEVLVWDEVGGGRMRGMTREVQESAAETNAAKKRDKWERQRQSDGGKDLGGIMIGTTPDCKVERKDTWH